MPDANIDYAQAAPVTRATAEPTLESQLESTLRSATRAPFSTSVPAAAHTSQRTATCWPSSPQQGCAQRHTHLAPAINAAAEALPLDDDACTGRGPGRSRRRLAAVAHDPLFDSAWLKWTQAMVHSQTLQRDIDAQTRDGGTNPVRAFRTEYHPKRHGFAIVVEDIAPIPVRWRLLLGDIANNYRAALDHLTWALVTRGRTPPEKLTPAQEKTVTFPIFENRLKYNRSLAKKLPGVRRADATKVRWCQPYRRGARNRPQDPLVLLASINNGDKHRAIQPAWTFPSRIDVEVTHMRNCVLRGVEHWRRRRNRWRTAQRWHSCTAESSAAIPSLRCSSTSPRRQPLATASASESGTQ